MEEEKNEEGDARQGGGSLFCRPVVTLLFVLEKIPPETIFFCNGRRAVSSGDLAVLFLALMRSRGRAFIHSLYRVAARD